MRVMASDYMYWAKTQVPVRYALGSSEVPPCHLDRFPLTIANLELDGASRYRYPPLREAIARHAGVTADRVVMADGTSMANMLALSALLSPGDEVVAEHPVYEPMVATAAHLGATIRSFERRAPDFAVDPAAVEQAVTDRTRVILITNLHNPTGNLADEATLRAIGDLAARVGAHVVVDEVYLDAAVPPQRTSALLGERFVVTSSLTKCYGLSGIRCGWILAEPALAERIWRLNELFGVAQSHAAERLALVAFEHLGEIAAANAALLQRNRALANAFVESRDDLDCVPMTGGITAFPRLLHGDVDALNRLLRERYDTSIVPGRFFGAADRFRMGVGGPTDIVEGGLERLGAALDTIK
ncbi:aminotransferase class I/II-fold pyridoxal phosphate-dependent enzyme [Sphingomonas sp. MAH-20]|uniref:Aminotransferase class I/II-fold pyridoxal phosphate-dependent enzyme n=2 Tax=Sphingomonadaceae TaxID=41297 RepID=A0A6I4J277_9SPHN|nr:aminotransferase class I/II-fold pyridoxal phosphate-dependent enzyme [Sphingomonas sp. CGMCC 1.13658]MVO78394.1 aminotransferase class I/II-fold pyridoxal phosphate-dependent enzyme [Sphingomonas horti]